MFFLKEEILTYQNNQKSPHFDESTGQNSHLNQKLHIGGHILYSKDIFKHVLTTVLGISFNFLFAEESYEMLIYAESFCL